MPQDAALLLHVHNFSFICAHNECNTLSFTKSSFCHNGKIGTNYFHIEFKNNSWDNTF